MDNKILERIFRKYMRKEDLEKYQINQEEFKITEFEKYVVIENK